ncbi:MAG: hypothetical protein KDE46_27465, partial [Caldilineaceae bacterium]|nr:hypothetical protein [Caldilineaceae bacterium]
SWLQIQKGTLTGWVSGSYVKADGCPTPQTRPPAIQACIPFKNHFNMEATITMTGPDREWTFYVQPKQTKTECFKAGDHTWSISIGDYRMNGGGYIAPGYYDVVNIYREF